MNSGEITKHLSQKIGGKPKDWKRATKFKYGNDDEFAEKQEGLSLDDLKHGITDFFHGSIPHAGLCRVFHGTVKDRDWTVHVLSLSDDAKIEGISATSD